MILQNRFGDLSHVLTGVAIVGRRLLPGRCQQRAGESVDLRASVVEVVLSCDRSALSPQQPNLVSIGSLSKLYWGGLRTGWIRASAGLIGRIAAAKATADLGSAAFGQAIAAALLNGPHDDIVKWREQWLRARHDALASALRTHLPGWTWPEPDGGLSLWVRLPGPLDSGAFAQAALRHGIAVVPGRLLSATGQASEYIRLAFTQPPPTLTRSVLALAQAAT